MKLSEIPTYRLREILDATERLVGSDSSSAEMLRSELARRDAEAKALLRSREVGKGGER